MKAINISKEIILGGTMRNLKQWAINYYLWIMLGLSIIGASFGWVTVYQVYQIAVFKNEPAAVQTFKVIVMPDEKNAKDNEIRKEIKIKVNPGDKVGNIAKKLEDAQVVPEDELFIYMENNNISLEGIVFEGEYSLPAPSSPKETIAILTGPYKEWIKTDYRKYKDIDKSPIEIITIASMIEKEAAEDSERPMIAGVIYNRLSNNMKLQIDATVIYALGEHKSRLSYEDLKVQSPYNTYIVEGLPPTPICVPKNESIQAALNPISHSYYYYVVSAYGSRQHHFAETYDEHLINVAKYKSTMTK